MNKVVYYLIIMLVFTAIALAYNLYYLWFVPEKYVKDLINSVKNWWPFANFYRKWFASKTYLWLFRTVYTMLLLLVLAFLCLVVLGIMGLFP